MITELFDILLITEDTLKQYQSILLFQVGGDGLSQSQGVNRAS